MSNNELLEASIGIGTVISLLALLVSVLVIGFLPSWFCMQGDWNGYLYWMPIAMFVSRLSYVLLVPINLITGIYYKNPGNIIKIPLMIVMAIWGIPVLQTALFNIASMELFGLELQRTILQIICIEGLAISIAIPSENKDKKEKKE